MNTGLLCLAFCVAVAPNAAAQSRWADRVFVNASGGVQLGTRTLATVTTFDLYEEPAKINSSQQIKNPPFFDVSAGYRAWDNLALALGYSWASRSTDVAITASIPDPTFFDKPRTITASATGLKHTENAIHLMGVWMTPLSDMMDVGISVGPSVFMINQDLPGELALAEPGPTVSGVTVKSVSKTTVGFNAGADFTYKLSKRAGVGLLARYTWGSATLEGASDKLTVGGFQIGLGVRIRY